MLENETLDYKGKFGKNTLKTLCAFANTKGGVVVIGVTDIGKKRE